MTVRDWLWAAMFTLAYAAACFGFGMAVGGVVR